MKRTSLLLIVITALLTVPALAAPTFYEGELSTANGGLTATPGSMWEKYGVSVSWTGWYEDGLSYIAYHVETYTPEGYAEISHANFGVSDSFQLEKWSMPAGFGELSLGNFDGIDNCLKLDIASENELDVLFVSRRAFQPQDFYAKDGMCGGELNAAWNTPGYYILGFDTQDVPPSIPVPAALPLLGFGTGIVGLMRMRRKAF